MSDYKFGLMMAAMLPPENLTENMSSILASGMNLSDRNRTMFSVVDSNNKAENYRAKEKRTAKKVGLEVIDALTTEDVGKLDDKEFAEKFKLAHKYGLADAVREKDSEIVIIEEIESHEAMVAELHTLLAAQKKELARSDLPEKYPTLHRHELLEMFEHFIK